MQEAEDLVLNHGFVITNKVKVPVDTISNVVEEYLNGINVDILFIDVEGLELQIFHNPHPSPNSHLIIFSFNNVPTSTTIIQFKD
jgi:hypothetical protein